MNFWRMFKVFIHISVAISLFFSSAGVWIVNHYCKNELVKSSFFISIHNSCCQEETTNFCTYACTSDKRKNKTGQQHENEGCCHNEKEIHKLEQDQQKEEIEIKSFQVYDLSITINTLFNTGLFSKNNLQNKYYKPPLIFFDHQAQLQTFLL